MADKSGKTASASQHEPIDVDALRAGDSDAFSALVRAYHKPMLVVARGMVGISDAEAVVQDAWLKAFQAIATFEGRSKLRTWLTAIVVNEGRMYLRRSARCLSVSIEEADDVLERRFDDSGRWKEPPLSWGLPGPEDVIRQQQFGSCLQKVLAQLPLQQGAVIELRDMQGDSLENIAKNLGLSAGNVRVLLHRARTRLYEAIEHFEDTGLC